MQLTHYTDASAFYQATEAFLTTHEAEHCLPLGILTFARQRPDPPRHQPYFAAVMEGDAVVAVAIQTPPQNLVLSRIEHPEAIALIAADRHAWGGMLAGVMGAPASALAFAEAWQQLTGQSFRRAFAERIFQLTHVNPVAGVPGQMRRIQEGDRALMRDWIRAFEFEALGANMTMPSMPASTAI